MVQKITITLPSEILTQLPQQHQERWIQQAIAEKLSREVGIQTEFRGVNQRTMSTEYLTPASAEAKAISRLANPIAEEDWLTVGTLDDEIDLEEINQAIQVEGYAG